MMNFSTILLLKWAALLLLLATGLTGLVLLVVSRIELYQAQQARQWQQTRPVAAATTSTQAVVYFSRSGNTGIVAAHLARRLGAKLFRLQATDYTPGLSGLLRALADARSHAANVDAAAVDLRGIRSLYLGSPIWLYSPAPPIWAFVRNTRLDGIDVVLFNTFNSKFEQRFIDEFAALVRQQGARSFRHLHVKRGRMGQQLTTTDMLTAVDSEWLP